MERKTRVIFVDRKIVDPLERRLGALRLKFSGAGSQIRVEIVEGDEAATLEKTIRRTRPWQRIRKTD